MTTTVISDPHPRAEQRPDDPRCWRALDPEPYIDTIALLFPKAPPPAIVKKIKKYCGSVKQEELDARRRFGYSWKIFFHQPTRDAFAMIEKFRRVHHGIITEVHFTLDLMADNPDDPSDQRPAMKLKRWIDARWVQRYRRADPMGGCENTSYGHRRRWRIKQPVCYVDRSKLTGRWCAHLEYRLLGAPKVRAAGITQCTDLPKTCISFWKKHLILEEVDYRKLGRQIRRNASDAAVVRCGSFIYDREKRAAVFALHRAAYYFGDRAGRTGQLCRLLPKMPSYQHLRPYRAVQRIDNTPFLPQPAIIQ